MGRDSGLRWPSDQGHWFQCTTKLKGTSSRYHTSPACRQCHKKNLWGRKRDVSIAYLNTETLPAKTRQNSLTVLVKIKRYVTYSSTKPSPSHFFPSLPLLISNWSEPMPLISLNRWICNYCATALRLPFGKRQCSWPWFEIVNRGEKCSPISPECSNFPVRADGKLAFWV